MATCPTVNTKHSGMGVVANITPIHANSATIQKRLEGGGGRFNVKNAERVPDHPPHPSRLVSFFGIKNTGLGRPAAGFQSGFKFSKLSLSGKMLRKKNTMGISFRQVMSGGAVLPRDPGGVDEFKNKSIIMFGKRSRLGLDALRNEDQPRADH